MFDIHHRLFVDIWTSASCGSRVERINPFCFLAECRKSRLNQALSVLSLSLDVFFPSVSIVLLTRATFALSYFVLLCVLSLSWLSLLGCQYQCK